MALLKCILNSIAVRIVESETLARRQNSPRSAAICLSKSHLVLHYYMVILVSFGGFRRRHLMNQLSLPFGGSIARGRMNRSGILFSSSCISSSLANTLTMGHSFSVNIGDTVHHRPPY